MNYYCVKRIGRYPYCENEQKVIYCHQDIEQCKQIINKIEDLGLIDDDCWNLSLELVNNSSLIYQIREAEENKPCDHCYHNVETIFKNNKPLFKYVCCKCENEQIYISNIIEDDNKKDCNYGNTFK